MILGAGVLWLMLLKFLVYVLSSNSLESQKQTKVRSILKHIVTVFLRRNEVIRRRNGVIAT